MKGKVNARREPIVRLRLCGRGKVRRNVAAIVDTGYTGSLTLPPAVVRSLGLRHIAQSEAELGDGRVVSFEVYCGAVMWRGRRLAVEIDAARTDPLIGMALMAGCELKIQMRRGGDVSISRCAAQQH